VGYEAEAKTYKLKFEDFPGLEVTAREPSLAEMLELQELAEETSTAGVRKLFGVFADHLAEWNLTKGGKPVPATLDGLLGQGAGFVQALAEGFINAVTGVPRDLGKGSGSGASPAGAPPGLTEASIPMTASQES